MHDETRMQSVETFNHLVENMPNLRLFHLGACSFEIGDFGLEIAAIRKLHNYAQAASCLLEKRLFIASHIGMLHRCQNAHLVDGVLLFLLRELGQPHLLQCVYALIRLPEHLVDLAECAGPYLALGYKVGGHL